MNKALCGCLVLSIMVLSSEAQDNYKEISLPQLMQKKKGGENNMLILDVRTKGEFYDTVSRNAQSNIGRLRDAINIPLQELEQNPEAIKQIEAYRDKDIYVICSHSYRSRSISNLLLKNGFNNVYNVKGGMTEWYRRYSDLQQYRDQLLDTGIVYKNISSAQVAKDIIDGKKILLIGISNTPRYFYDSATISFYSYFPEFKNASYFNFADSMTLLKFVTKNKNRPVVLFNTVNNGAAELAAWMTRKGIPNVTYLVGNLYYFYEYIRNNELLAKAGKHLKNKNLINFITPLNFCDKLTKQPGLQLIDLRHDSLYNKMTDGIKYNFLHAKGSVNFFEGLGVVSFMQQYRDKSHEYVLISLNGINGLELAKGLVENGYKISWVMGGQQRLEWYTVNTDDFKCEDILLP
jgi:rhodanese-related sulfurtransferase